MTVHIHGACGKTWTGTRKAHCGRCHETFHGMKAFDRHQRAGECLSPLLVGCQQREGAWGFPKTGTEWVTKVRKT